MNVSSFQSNAVSPFKQSKSGVSFAGETKNTNLEVPTQEQIKQDMADFKTVQRNMLAAGKIDLKGAQQTAKEKEDAYEKAKDNTVEKQSAYDAAKDKHKDAKEDLKIDKNNTTYKAAVTDAESEVNATKAELDKAVEGEKSAKKAHDAAQKALARESNKFNKFFGNVKEKISNLASNVKESAKKAADEAGEEAKAEAKNGGGKTKWYIAGGLAVLGVLAYLFTRGGNKKEAPAQQEIKA